MLIGIDPITILIIGGGFAFLTLMFGLVVSIRSEKTEVDQRLDRYLTAGHIIDQSNAEKSAALTDWFNKRVEKSSYCDQISIRLARADLKLKSGEYIAVIVLVAFAVGFVLFFLGGRNILVGLLGALIGAFLPGMYVKSLQAKRLIKFNDQLGDMLNLMVNGLRAGYSTMQAMEAVSKELPSPICDEFRRVVQEMQLGVPMERALANLLNRIPSDDLDLIITAINVQREVGGNLAEILDTISFTIRERVRIKGEIRVLTTQAMYSGRFLSALPLFVMGILYLLNREYMLTFFIPANNTPIPCGYIALGVGALFIIAGYFVMNKMGQIEV